MKIMVDHVLRNFSRFRESVTSHGEHKSYRVLIDPETGEMKFPQKIREIYSFQGKKNAALWQQVQLIKNQHHYHVEGATIQKISALKVIDKTLEKLNAEEQRKEIEKLPAWKGHLNAMQAEEKLRGQKKGTYLIRSFDDVSNMIETLKHESDCEILSYVLVTVVDEKKFSEALLLNIPRGWLIFQDEPNLHSYPVFTHPKKLIESIDNARTPL
jgi:hypothetical protein